MNVNDSEKRQDRGLVSLVTQLRRRHIVELTAVGRRALERADKAREGLEDEILAPLSAEERKMLNKLVERVLDGMLQETRS